MSEKWAWDGPPDNIHVFQADAPHMRICFLTSDGPTEERANLIAAAPEMLEALREAIRLLNVAFGEYACAAMPSISEIDRALFETNFAIPTRKLVDSGTAVIAKAEGRS